MAWPTCTAASRLKSASSASIRPNMAMSTAPSALRRTSHERVTIEHWAPGGTVSPANPDGLELLVVSGSLSDGNDEMGRWTWLRLPASLDLAAAIGPKGARVWMKRRRLLQDNVVPF